MPERAVPERRNVKRALRDLGMSNRQIAGLLRGGWKALVGEVQAENEELREKVNELFARVSK